MDRDARAFQAYLERPGRRRYARLVKRYYAFVWSVALRASGHREDALDLTHDLFLSLLRRPPAAGSVRSPRGYLATRVLTLLRRGRESAERRRLRELEAARRMAQRATPALDAADIETLRDEVARLPGRVRDAVELRYLVGLQNAEIAALLGVSERSVEDDLRRGRDILRSRAGRASLSALPALLADPGSPTAVFRTPPADLRASLLRMEELAAVLPPAPAKVGAAGLLSAKVAAAGVAALLLASILTALLLRTNPTPPIDPPQGEATAHAPLATTRAETTGEAPPALASRAVAAPPRDDLPGAASPEPAAPADANGAIHGRVFDGGTGDLLEGVTLSAGSADSTTRTDDNGEYALESLAAGRYRVATSAPGYLGLEKVIELTAGARFEQDFVLDPTLALVVSVVDEAGGPIPGASVTRAQLDGSYLGAEPSTRETDAAGRATIEGVSRLNPQQVRIEKEGFKTAWQRADPPAERDAAALELRVTLRSEELVERVLRGFVRRPDGVGVEDAAVTWAPTWGDANKREQVASGWGGAFELRFHTDHETCHLIATTAGFGPAIARNVRTAGAEEGAAIELTLTAGHWLAGTVIDEQDAPVAGATVLALPDLHLLHSPPTHTALARRATSDAKGSFTLTDLPGPKVTLQVTGPAGERWSATVLEDVEVDAERTLTLRRPGEIRGQVVEADSGDPVPMFHVRIKPVGEGWPRGLSYPRVHLGEAFGSPDGRFLLDDLPRSHRYDVLVEASDHPPFVLEAVSTEAAGSAVEHRIELSRGRTVEGTLVDFAAGAPIAGALVLSAVWDTPAEPADSWAWSQKPGYQRDTTPEDGRFHFLEEAPRSLLFLAPGYARRLVAPAERERHRDWRSGELRIALTAGASLTGVYYLDGAPKRGAFVDLIQRSAEGAADADADADAAPATVWLGGSETDAGGVFAFDSLQPGRYQLHQYRGARAERAVLRLLTHPLTLAAGEAGQVDLGDDLGALVLDGRVLDEEGEPVEEAELSLEPRFDWRYRALATNVAGGRFRLEGLRPGRYAVGLERQGRKAPLREVELQESMAVTLTAPRPEPAATAR